MIEMNVVVTGDAMLDQVLKSLIEPEGTKSINAVMRQACRDAVKEIVLPEVRANVPHRFGTLESKITVRAVKGGGRGTFGFYVGFPDKLFQGETFYGGFIEFGWDHYKGVTVQADSFLRKALYPNATRIVEFVRARMRAWINEVPSSAT